MIDENTAPVVDKEGFLLPADVRPDTAQVLLGNFRSMVIQLRRRADAGALPARAPAVAIARWMREYQCAYFEANRVLHDGRPHELRGRVLTFAGDGHLLFPDDVSVMAEHALVAGMTPNLGVTLEALATCQRELASLRERFPSIALTVDCTPLQTPRTPDALHQVGAALDDHVGRGGELRLVGDLATLRATGLLSREAANRVFIQIQAPSLHGVRFVHRRHDFAPCREHFALNIDEQGDVYPCLGMIGHLPARFGSVHEPFDRILQTLSACGSRVESLGRHGPRFDAHDAVYPTDLCALHRAVVSEIGQL